MPKKLYSQKKLDELYIRKALLVAKKSEFAGEVPVGAVVVREGEVIAAQHNQPITLADPTAHAEILALRQAANRLKNYRLLKATLYVTLEPCAMCVTAMIHARIERLVFGAYDKKSGAVCSQLSLLNGHLFNHQVNWKGGILEKPSSNLLREFFKNKRYLSDK